MHSAILRYGSSGRKGKTEKTKTKRATPVHSALLRYGSSGKKKKLKDKNKKSHTGA